MYMLCYSVTMWEMVCLMTKLKGPGPLVALLQVPTPKDTSVLDGVLDTNSVPSLAVSL
jgi:hypothetical protein